MWREFHQEVEKLLGGGEMENWQVGETISLQHPNTVGGFRDKHGLLLLYSNTETKHKYSRCNLI